MRKNHKVSRWEKVEKRKGEGCWPGDTTLQVRGRRDKTVPVISTLDASCLSSNT